MKILHKSGRKNAILNVDETRIVPSRDNTLIVSSRNNSNGRSNVERTSSYFTMVPCIIADGSILAILFILPYNESSGIGMDIGIEK